MSTIVELLLCGVCSYRVTHTARRSYPIFDFFKYFKKDNLAFNVLREEDEAALLPLKETYGSRCAESGKPSQPLHYESSDFGVLTQ